MPDIEFFFDFSSPFAYLAHCRLPFLADQYGWGIVYKPIDLFEARKHAGNTGPSTPQMPAKFRYIQTDLKRWGQKYGVPFIPPWMGKAAQGKPAPAGTVPREWVDSSRANKGTFFAEQKGQARDYVTCLWRGTFGSGGMVGDDALLRDVAKELGWSQDEFLAYVQSDEANRLYKQGQEEAHARGVFGVPIAMIGEEMWWGNDRLGFLEEYLAAHSAK
jgi:2-hydroxychromene-2-carboxylate isomerase